MHIKGCGYTIHKTSAISPSAEMSRVFFSKGATDAEFAERMLEIKHLLNFCLVPTTTTSSVTPVALKKVSWWTALFRFLFSWIIYNLINHDALLHLS